MVDVDGVPTILSQNTIYAYNERKDAWTVQARVKCTDTWSMLYKLSNNRCARASHNAFTQCSS